MTGQVSRPVNGCAMRRQDWSAPSPSSFGFTALGIAPRQYAPTVHRGSVERRRTQQRYDNDFVMWELVKQGLGIGVQDGVIGDREPLVRRVLPDREPLIYSMWLVTHREVNTSRRIRRGVRPDRRGVGEAIKAKQRPGLQSTRSALLRCGRGTAPTVRRI